MKYIITSFQLKDDRNIYTLDLTRQPNTRILGPHRPDKLGFMQQSFTYVGQSIYGIPQGFGVACTKSAALNSVLAFPNSKCPVSKFEALTMLIGFWDRGALNGIGMLKDIQLVQKFRANQDTIYVCQKIGSFLNGYLDSDGIVETKSYENINGSWVRREEGAPDATWRSEFTLLGRFKSGKLIGYGAAKVKENIIKGMFFENRLCEGEMVKNNGNGLGSTRSVVLQSPFNFIITHQEGEFQDYKLSGKGMQECEGKIIQTGMFKDNLIQTGKLEHKSNKYEYEGEFRNNKPNGLGKLLFLPNREIQFEGRFFTPKSADMGYILMLEGQIDGVTGNGIGKVSAIDIRLQRVVNQRISNFTNFELNDCGILEIELRSILTTKPLPRVYYNGQFRNNNPNGLGTIHLRDGSIITGLFTTESVRFTTKMECIYGEVVKNNGNGKGERMVIKRDTFEVESRERGRFENYKLVQGEDDEDGSRRDEEYSSKEDNDSKIENYKKENKSEKMNKEKDYLRLLEERIIKQQKGLIQGQRLVILALLVLLMFLKR